jgi:hypothetical protein
LIDGADGQTRRGRPDSPAPITTTSAAAFHQPNQDVGVSAARFFSLAVAEVSSKDFETQLRLVLESDEFRDSLPKPPEPRNLLNGSPWMDVLDLSGWMNLSGWRSISLKPRSRFVYLQNHAALSKT